MLQEGAEAMADDEDEEMEEATQAPAGDYVETGRTQLVISLQRDSEEETMIGDRPSPSPERYKQRTEVFENLMKFVNEDARQPEQNLWDMIDVDQLEERQ